MLKQFLLAAFATTVLVALCSYGAAYAAPSGEAGVDSGSVGAAAAGAPVYPGGHPINGGLMTQTLYSKPIGTSVTFSTNDRFEKVYAFYKHAVPKNAEAEETDGDPTSRIGTFKYVKGDGSQIDIEIRAFPGHTNYTIAHTFKK